MIVFINHNLPALPNTRLFIHYFFRNNLLFYNAIDKILHKNQKLEFASPSSSIRTSPFVGSR